MFLVWLSIKQRMTDNGWMYSGLVSATNKTDEWIYKTQMLVKELAHATKGRVRELCPCSRCLKHHRQGKDDMYKHFLQYGYMSHYVTYIDFDEHERNRGDVMRQWLMAMSMMGSETF
jgi:hypothetical protein